MELTQRTAENQATVDRLQAEVARRTTEYESIVTSVNWRAMSPIRNLLGRSPWITRQTRRILELVTATLQLRYRCCEGLWRIDKPKKQTYRTPGDPSLLVESAEF
jgi:hypothetical protein